MLEAACALARQCFINEYVWDCMTECGLADDLRRSVQADLDRGPTPSDAAVVAVGMYFPLASLIGDDRLLADRRPPYVAAVLAQQISEPAAERRLRGLIPRATSIDDELSQAVRDQYEANPYPRWVAMSGTSHRLQLEKWLTARFSGAPVAPLPTQAVLEVLVAGCGTGQQPIELTRQFANINVLAIDLSMASLAYAARMTAVHAVQGVEYVQADLLQGAQLGRSFDVIAAVGVLHHLADLWAGWRILLGLLRPRGVMTVSLYTVRGRSDVMRAREWISVHGYEPTPEGIRRCRRDLLALHDDWAIRVSSSPDFCSSSACRDLLFHVHEQAVTPLEVSEFLRTEEITLLGVLASPGTEQAFNAWAGGAHLDMARDLSRWDLFEEQHPACFAGMLNLWVQKAANNH
jgi:2-polyprenyl-3-methyl-5-hydroxy-6-metoxy-1,4-benzoquinol methylase